MKNSNQNGSVHSTTDYDIFKLKDYNRAIDPNHVRKLMKSIHKSEDLSLHPIIVTEELEVVDGQHRLEAAKKLGLPIYYIIDNHYDPEKLMIFNLTQKKWSPADSLNFYRKQGRDDYEKLYEFMSDVGFNLSCTLTWVSKTQRGYFTQFREGRFKFDIDEKTLEGILYTQKFINLMKSRDVKPLSMMTNRMFHLACKEFFGKGVIDGAEFLEKYQTSPYEIKNSQIWQQYFDQFVEIYNYDRRKQRLKNIHVGLTRELEI